MSNNRIMKILSNLCTRFHLQFTISILDFNKPSCVLFMLLGGWGVGRVSGKNNKT